MATISHRISVAYSWAIFIPTVSLPLLGGLYTARHNKRAVESWYRDLYLHPANPPPWTFKVVWTPLYAAMGYSLYRVVRLLPRALAIAGPTMLWGAVKLIVGWVFKGNANSQLEQSQAIHAVPHGQGDQISPQAQPPNLRSLVYQVVLHPSLAIPLFISQLVVNYSWCPLFFQYRQLGLSALVVTALLPLIAWTGAVFYRIDPSPLTKYTWLAYGSWITLALFLNSYIWYANRGCKFVKRSELDGGGYHIIHPRCDGKIRRNVHVHKPAGH